MKLKVKKQLHSKLKKHLKKMMLMLLLGCMFFNTQTITYASSSLGISGMFDGVELRVTRGGVIDTDEMGITLLNLSTAPISVKIEFSKHQYLTITPAIDEAIIDFSKFVHIPIKIMVDPEAEIFTHQITMQIIVQPNSDEETIIQLFATLLVEPAASDIKISLVGDINQPLEATIQLFAINPGDLNLIPMIKTHGSNLETTLPSGDYQVHVTAEGNVLDTQALTIEPNITRSMINPFKEITLMLDTLFIPFLQLQVNYNFLQQQNKIEASYQLINLDPEDEFDAYLVVSNDQVILYDQKIHQWEKGIVGKHEAVVLLDYPSNKDNQNIEAFIKIVDKYNQVVLVSPVVILTNTQTMNSIYWLVLALGFVFIVLTTFLLVLFRKKNEGSLFETSQDEPQPKQLIKRRSFKISKNRVCNITTNQDYHHIQDAIDHANPYDTIHIYPGIYQEYLNIHQPLTILGPASLHHQPHQQEAKIITPTKNVNPVHVMINSHDVVLSGLTVESSDMDAQSSIAILLKKSHVTIENIKIKGYNQTQLLVASDQHDSSNQEVIYDGIIRNNTFIQATIYAIVVIKASVLIENNQFIDCVGGIKVDPIQAGIKGVIKDNSIQYKKIGITLCQDHLYKSYWQIYQNEKEKLK